MLENGSLVIPQVMTNFHYFSLFILILVFYIIVNLLSCSLFYFLLILLVGDTGLIYIYAYIRLQVQQY